MTSGRRWRRFQTGARLFKNPLVIIPVLNVFVLLFLFVVFNSAFVLRPGIKVQLPIGVFQQGSYYSSQTVIVTQEGLAFYNDERVQLENLADTLRLSAGKRSSAELVIEADLRVPYDSIIRVLNMASTAGISNVYLSVRPTFGEETMP